MKEHHVREMLMELTAAYHRLPDKEFRELKEDIRKNGLLVPIRRYRGQIVDGHNRAKACEELGITPRYEDMSDKDMPSVTQLVYSLNLYRRHLTDSQRATAGNDYIKYLKMEEELTGKVLLPKAPAQRQVTVEEAMEHIAKRNAAKDAKELKGKKSEMAAKAVGVSPRMIELAKKIEIADPELYQEVKQGKLTINQAIGILANTPSIDKEKVAEKISHEEAIKEWRRRYSTIVLMDDSKTWGFNEIASIPIRQFCAHDCLIFLWVDDQGLGAVFQQLELFGAEYVGCAVWHGHPSLENRRIGGAFESQARFLAVIKRGDIEPNQKLPNVITSISPESAYSEALDLIYKISRPPFLLFGTLEHDGYETRLFEIT